MAAELLTQSGESASSEEYWNGPPPPYAAVPPPAPPSFWSRPGVWIGIALVVLGASGFYFFFWAVGSGASAPGGCGGG